MRGRRATMQIYEVRDAVLLVDSMNPQIHQLLNA
jgi:hypothetical protein